MEGSAGGGSSKQLLGDLLGYPGWWKNEGDDEKVSSNGDGVPDHKMLMNRPVLDVVDEDHAMLLRKLREKIDR